MAVKFCSLIRTYRKKAGISQKELADLAGVGKTTVFDIENGKETVRLKNILKVLTVLNIKLTAEGPFGDKINVDMNYEES